MYLPDIDKAFSCSGPFAPSQRCFKVARAALQAFLMFLLESNARSASFVVTNAADQGSGSFRQALLDASQSPGVDEITFSNVSGTITLLSNPPPIADVTILGPGARQLTISTPHMVIPVGATSIVSGIRFAYNSNQGTPDTLSAGILGNYGALRLQNCELVSAFTPAKGAAVYVGLGGNLVMCGCTIANNTDEPTTLLPVYDQCVHGGSGGGLCVEDGSAVITNSTFSGNSAASFLSCNGMGGAVSVYTGMVQIVNCTLSGNSAAIGGAIYNMGGTVTLQNSIVTDSIFGPVSLVGANLLTSADAAGLGPLQDNGGPTLTMALAKNSPAINAASSSAAPATDQRGIVRPQGTASDLGAFEFEVPKDYVQLDLAIIGHGTILRNPDQVFFPSNSSVILTAISDEDYALSAWSGNAAGQQDPLSLFMDGDKSVVAIFQYTPTTVTNPPGATSYVLNTNGWGPNSFRQSIRDINASGGGAICVSNLTGQISLPLGLPALQVPFSISGPGSSNLLLSVPSGVQAFTVNAGITGTISGLSIESSQSSNSYGAAMVNAGNLFVRDVDLLYCACSNGGAVFNSGILQASNCTFSNNFAGSGGAIYNSGDLFLNDSVFSGNTCSNVAGVFTNGGGALYNAAGSARVANCVFKGNRSVGTDGGVLLITGGSGLGGAIYISSGDVRLTDTLICSNEVHGGNGATTDFGQGGGGGGSALGAGIFLGGGTLTLSKSALVYNRATGGDAPPVSRSGGHGGEAQGGAVCASAGQLLGANCTFSGNQVFGGRTGGAPLIGPPPGGADGIGGALAVLNSLAALTNFTITGNRANGGNPFFDPGGLMLPGRGLGGGIEINGSGYYTGTVAFLNTILYGNFGATNGTNVIVVDDVNGPGLSLGHNLLGATIGFTNIAPTDLFGLAPRLGPLQDNGGGTLTHALLAGSPAIDAGAPTGRMALT